MKLSFRSKLIARTTPGLIVCSARPIAESASALIMPPWTKPALLAMSSEAVISRVAAPSSSSICRIPNHVQAADTKWVLLLLTALALRHRPARRGGPRDEAPLRVGNVGPAEGAAPRPGAAAPAGHFEHVRFVLTWAQDSSRLRVEHVQIHM